MLTGDLLFYYKSPQVSTYVTSVLPGVWLSLRQGIFSRVYGGVRDRLTSPGIWRSQREAFFPGYMAVSERGIFPWVCDGLGD